MSHIQCDILQTAVVVVVVVVVATRRLSHDSTFVCFKNYFVFPNFWLKDEEKSCC